MISEGVFSQKYCIFVLAAMAHKRKTGWAVPGNWAAKNRKRDDARKFKKIKQFLDDNPDIKNAVVQHPLVKAEVARLQMELNAALCRNLGYEAQLQVKVKLEKQVKLEPKE